MAARPSWEGHLAFNLVSIPVKAFNAMGGGSGKIGFHLLHKGCNERIRYQKVCPVHGEVTNDEIVSGYEYQKGRYVTVDKDEKGNLRDTDDKTISVDTFVPPDAIDPIYFSGRTYYLVPNGPAAQKPYAVMFAAMRAHERVGVARLVLSGRGHVAVVRPFGKLLGMTLLAFEDEVKAPGPFEAEVSNPTVSAKERDLAGALLESADSDFDLHEYKDRYAERLEKLVARKAGRAARKHVSDEANGAVGDLMEVLRKSLAHARPGSGSRRARAATGPRRRRSTKAGRGRRS